MLNLVPACIETPTSYVSPLPTAAWSIQPRTRVRSQKSGEWTLVTVHRRLEQNYRACIFMQSRKMVDPMEKEALIFQEEYQFYEKQLERHPTCEKFISWLILYPKQKMFLVQETQQLIVSRPARALKILMVWQPKNEAMVVTRHNNSWKKLRWQKCAVKLMMSLDHTIAVRRSSHWGQSFVLTSLICLKAFNHKRFIDNGSGPTVVMLRNITLRMHYPTCNSSARFLW